MPLCLFSLMHGIVQCRGASKKGLAAATTRPIHHSARLNIGTKYQRICMVSKLCLLMNIKQEPSLVLPLDYLSEPNLRSIELDTGLKVVLHLYLTAKA